jgi:hypothetical protein
MTGHHRKNAMLAAVLLAALLAASHLAAAPQPALWPRWQAHDPDSTRVVDHALWGQFLDSYLVSDHPSGIHRLRYAAVDRQGRALLQDYLEDLQQTAVSRLNRPEQKAYWINLYNALVVKLVVDHYPVASIQDIALPSGLFGWLRRGPWKAPLAVVEGQELALDDIEHRILRPIWKDNRIHYAVNCASMACPNLQPEPFTAGNSERLLDRGARDYVNHPRGVRWGPDQRLIVSSIYDWFQEDFGGTEEGVLRHLQAFADPDRAARLGSYREGLRYEYDWRLNDVE